MLQIYLALYMSSLILLQLANTYVSAENFCGLDWANADATCTIACPLGTDSECPPGQYCFANTCEGNPIGNYNYCGLDWSDANSSCNAPCAGGSNDECPQGTYCFAECTSCDIASPPTTPAPTISSQPTTAPVLPTTPAPFAAGPCDLDAKMSVNVGYYQSWAVWRDGCSIVQPEDIDIVGMGYTHLIYAFASISSSLTIEAWQGAASEEIPRMQRMNALKASYPGLKTLIGVGGWSHNDPGVLCNRFSAVSASDSTRQDFANSVVAFLKDNNFDGIDFDWEYPADTERCGVPEDKENYALLVQAVREALDADSNGYLVTMAVPVSIPRLEEGYNLPSLKQDLDWFNVMTYDIAGSWSSEVGSHTDMRHIREVMPHFLNEGVPSTSLVFGLGAYGRTFSLTNTDCIDIGCPFNGARGGGCPVWDEVGYTAYLTIQDIIASGDYIKYVVNPVTESMELVTPDYEFISFDSEETFSIKVSYASEMCMRGYMWWAVDMIDESFTIEIHNPTISPAPTISSQPTLTPSISLMPTTKQPTNQPVAGPVCPIGHTGWLPYLECTHYFYCQDGNLVGEPYACAEGTIYDVSIGNCNWITSGVVCENINPTISPSPTRSHNPTQQPAVGPVCPIGHTGWLPYLYCTHYFYCEEGNLVATYACPEDTIYDISIGSCNWISSGVTCEEVPPTASPQTPTISPTTLPCYDALLPVRFSGFQLSCQNIFSFGACTNPVAQSHCPEICNACLEYKCEDSLAPFVAGDRDVQCTDLQGFSDTQIDEYCELPQLYTTCRRTCKICDA